MIDMTPEEKEARFNKSKIMIEGWMISAGITASGALVAFAKVYGTQKKFGNGTSEYTLMKLFGCTGKGDPKDMQNRRRYVDSMKWLVNAGLVEEQSKTSEKGIGYKVYRYVEGSVFIPEECR